MKSYQCLLQDILNNGARKGDRTGVGTLSVFGRQMRYDLQAGFPILTTKKVFLKGVIHELLWFLNGDTNIEYLKSHGVKIWDEWADEHGDIGPGYGYQWRSWPDIKIATSWEASDALRSRGYKQKGPFYEHSLGEFHIMRREVDQLQDVINALIHNPDSRRILVNAWNVGDIESMGLPPCHLLFQFYSRPATLAGRLRWRANHSEGDEASRWWELLAGIESGAIPERYARAEMSRYGEKAPARVLSCQLYQRSADTFLGLPFNLSSYALLTMMVAQVTGHMPGEFIHTTGDTHLYLNHLEQARTQLSREPRALPRMRINPAVTSLFDFTYEDFTLDGYDPHPAIKAPVAV